MKIQEILDSIYIIPVILEHFEKPTAATKAILSQQGISDDRIEECRKIKSLLQYHYDIIFYDYSSDYSVLREGLKQYWNEHLKGMFQIMGLTDTKRSLLDYGCGAGQVADQFKIDNPDATIFKVDKIAISDGIKVVDFEDNPYWSDEYYQEFDIVMLSEVLHCKSKIIQNYLIRSSYHMLKPNGLLIIVENTDEIMAHRISKIKKMNAKILDEEDIHLLVSSSFALLDLYQIERHKIYKYAKI